jgi:hypothetical protein
LNFNHQMSLSKSKCWHSNNCLPFLKCVVSLRWIYYSRNIYKRHCNENFREKRLLKMLIGSTWFVSCFHPLWNNITQVLFIVTFIILWYGFYKLKCIFLFLLWSLIPSGVEPTNSWSVVEHSTADYRLECLSLSVTCTLV